MDKAWKQFERQVAKFFGTVRNSLCGSCAKITGSDTLHATLYIECKYHKKLPVFLTKLYSKTLKNAKREGKVPVMCFKEHGMPGFFIITHSTEQSNAAITV